MDAATSVAIELIYIGSASNLRNRLGQHIGSYLRRKGRLHESKTYLGPAEKCAVDDGKQVKVSYAKTDVNPMDWESELLNHYIAHHGVNPGYRNLAGEWCRGNKQPVNGFTPERPQLDWSPFEEFGEDLKSRLPKEPGVYRLCV